MGEGTSKGQVTGMGKVGWVGVGETGLSSPSEVNIAGEHGQHAEKKVHLKERSLLFFCLHLCCCFDGGLGASLWLQ